MKHAGRIVLVFALLASTLVAQDESIVDKIVKEGRENSKVMAHLEQLTIKGGPRLTGSDRCAAACEWAKKQFEGWGLKASLDEWNASAANPIFKVGFNRGPWSAKMTAPEEMDIVCTTPAWQPGTDGPKSGPAYLLAPDDEVDEKLAKGAWVVVTGRPAGSLLEECEKAGAHGFLRAGDESLQGGGNPPASMERIPKRVSITLLGSHHKKIVGLCKEGKEVKLTFDLKNEFKKGPVPCYNVIADIVGSEKPDEFVVVGGHIDSWDGAQGCTDNGTGSSTTLEAARILSAIGAKPKRTIRFMLWSGEEQGLLGSSSWCRRNKELMPKVSACFVHDMGTNYLSGLGVTEKMMPLFEKICAPLMKQEEGSDDPLVKLNKEFPFKLSKARLSGSFGGGSSDHASFLAQGVPGFFWNQSGKAVYSKGWHTRHDKYELAVPEYQQRSSIVIAIVALGVANLDGLLPRDGMREGPGGGGGGGGNRRVLGVQCEDDLVLSSITEGSAAEKAGLKDGDQILKIGDTACSNLEELRAAIQGAKKESTVTFKRDGKEQTVKVTFER